eukprot:s5220_g4.t1
MAGKSCGGSDAPAEKVWVAGVVSARDMGPSFPSFNQNLRVACLCPERHAPTLTCHETCCASAASMMSPTPISCARSRSRPILKRTKWLPSSRSVRIWRCIASMRRMHHSRR